MAFDKRSSEWTVAQKVHEFNFHNPVATKNLPIPFCVRKGGSEILFKKLNEVDLKKISAPWSSANVQLGKNIARNKGPNHRDITDETVFSSFYPLSSNLITLKLLS